jgi:uncharacterized protein (DUF4415 family)
MEKQKVGRPKVDNPLVAVQVRLTKETLEMLRAAAAKDGITISGYLRTLLS